MESLGHTAIAWLIRALEFIFIAGMMGSAIVLLFSFVDDFKTAFDRD